jgi:diguanylate cyclase (GGDEF)-like protein
VNQFHEEWFGQPVPELTGKTMREVLGAEDYENCRQHIENALHGQRVTFEQCMIRNNLERFLQIVYIPEYDSSKQVVGFYVLGNNTTERKLNETRLESIALYDALTGVANRLLLADRVSQAIAHAQRHSTSMALIYLDLDGFKEVNDTFGHDVGDLLLREVAERLVSSLRQEDTVARLGGDEFVIAIWQVVGAQDAATVAAKLVTSVSQPYDIRGNTLGLTASAGVSLYPAQGKDMETLLKSADLAMYEAKRGGKNAYRVFDDRQKMYA